MLQPKDIEWLNEYKNKTRIYAVYKRPTSDLGTRTDWKWGDGKRYCMHGNQKKARVAILITEKIDFKIKTITRDKEGHYIMIKGSFQEEDITIVCKQYLCTQHRSTSIHKANANSHKRGNWP